MSKGNLVWGIDIGTGKVAVSLIEHDTKGAFFVRNVGVAGSQGVKRGTTADGKITVTGTCIESPRKVAPERQ